MQLHEKARNNHLCWKDLEFKSELSSSVPSESVGKADKLILTHNLQHLCHTTAAPRAEGSQGHCGVYTMSTM